ncbi:hypothetical protein [Stenotrophomonas maltophilia]|uniref:hypothetical protein n=1 Tax=Stenotrophomonas maltophilia TaxID=40324 RepID=UPI001F5311EC|nr:hypothetical protein [Stenotrophomonas maltophilia]MCI1124788.1 hypothetical protein [Stenotrophomonas maltophilia]
MSERRPLNPAEKAAAASLDGFMNESAMTNESAASLIGVTPAAVGHWRRGEIPVPLKRAARIGKMLAVDPGLICAEWAASVSPYLAQSQVLQIDPEILASAAKLVRLAFRELDTVHDPEEDGVPVALAYQYLARRQLAKVVPNNVVDFSKYLKKHLGGGDDDRVTRAGSASASNR